MRDAFRRIQENARECIFFCSEFTEPDFRKALANDNEVFTRSLSESYIGFAVIRPIPHTFLAKVCVRPYEALTSKPGYKVITKEHHVSLFGLPLKVTTAAFLEQDKVVSACATSALWMLFSSSSHKSFDSLPSPSAITKSASLYTSEASRTFPTSGLSPMQVARSLKHFGLEPLILHCSANANANELKERVYSYVGNDIPVLIGGLIFRTRPNEKAKCLGRHLVCALGYHVQHRTYDGADYKLLAHDIDKIYVHDDRFGPYLRIETKPETFASEDGPKEGLALSILNEETKEYIVPDISIIGLYHKVRIPYIDIWNMCGALHTYTHKTSEAIEANISRTDIDKKHDMQATLAAIKTLILGSWDISLTTNTTIKEEIIHSPDFISYNGAYNKPAFLLKSTPRYIWKCRIWSINQDQKTALTDLLFDATEVPQGQVLLGFISYSLEAERAWRTLEQAANDAWPQYEAPSEAKRHISALLRFFTKNKDRTYLNTAYGPLSLPRRALHSGETDQLNNIQQRSDVRIIRRGSTTNWNWLCQNTKYIWVINELGDIVIGEDISDPNDGKQGHPTLTDGKPARLGGELYYSEEQWLVNLRSGTYSSHLEDNSEESALYLNNVININLAGLSAIKAQTRENREQV